MVWNGMEQVACLLSGKKDVKICRQVYINGVVSIIADGSAVVIWFRDTIPQT